MSDDFKEYELFILNLLYTNRCLKRNRGYNSKKLKDILLKKCSKDYDDKECKRKIKKSIRNLLNQGYIAKVGKKDDKYYISDIPKTFSTLDAYGYKVTRGRERKL